MFHKIYLLLLIVLISACANQNLAPIELNNNNDLQFSGKGSAAGVMLMSAMGPAGIAIGVAIDVGIAKEIADTAAQGDVNIERIIKKELRPFLKTQTSPVSITIERYGFLIWQGEGEDPTIAQLHLKIKSASDEIEMRYPEDFDQESAVFQTAELESLKTDAELINRLLHHSARSINQQLLQ